MKKNAPEELNNEELEIVAGGAEVLLSLPVIETTRNVTANGGESCSLCKKTFEKGETMYWYERGLKLTKLCSQCNHTRITNGHQFNSLLGE